MSHKEQLTHFYSRKSNSSPHSHLPFGAGGTNLAILTCITWWTLYTNSAVRTHIPPPTSLNTHISLHYCTSLLPHLLTHISPLHCTSLNTHLSLPHLSTHISLPYCTSLPPTFLNTHLFPLHCTSLPLTSLNIHLSTHITQQWRRKHIMTGPARPRTRNYA